MRNYDYQKAKEYIAANADQIEAALMGMHEDWFWTAETVFSEGEFKKDLDDADLTLGGINGSRWATPVLEVLFKDGHEKTIDCFVQEGEQTAPPDDLALGAFSAPVQASRAAIDVQKKLN